MIITLDYCKALLGVTTTAHDTYLSSLIQAAEGTISAWLHQPIARTPVTTAAPCVPVPDSVYCVAQLDGSINVALTSVEAKGYDITSLCSVDGWRLFVPPDYVHMVVEATYESGWTQDTVPDLVKYAIARIVRHYYVRTDLAALNVAGLSSLTQSDGGVVTFSRVIDRNELDDILLPLKQWRILRL